MKNISLQRMGGMGSLLVAFFAGLFVTLLLVALLVVRQPGVVSWFYVLSDYVLALAGLFGLAAVPAIHARVAPLSEGWMRWTSTLALIGFVMMAVTGFWHAESETSLIGSWSPLPAEIAPDLAIPMTSLAIFLDLLGHVPLGWFEAAGIGLWVFSVSWLARGTDLLSQGVIRIGLAAGVLSVAAMLGAAPQLALLLLPIMMTGGLLLSTLWFFQVGLLLLREEKEEQKERMEASKIHWTEAIDTQP